MWMTLDSYLSLPWMILDVVIRDKNAGDHPSHRYPPRRAAVLGGRLPYPVEDDVASYGHGPQLPSTSARSSGPTPPLPSTSHGHSTALTHIWLLSPLSTPSRTIDANYAET